jgi:hypothetical protein
LVSKDVKLEEVGVSVVSLLDKDSVVDVIWSKLDVEDVVSLAAVGKDDVVVELVSKILELEEVGVSVVLLLHADSVVDVIWSKLDVEDVVSIAAVGKDDVVVKLLSRVLELE